MSTDQRGKLLAQRAQEIALPQDHRSRRRRFRVKRKQQFTAHFLSTKISQWLIITQLLWSLLGPCETISIKLHSHISLLRGIVIGLSKPEREKPQKTKRRKVVHDPVLIPPLLLYLLCTLVYYSEEIRTTVALCWPQPTEVRKKGTNKRIVFYTRMRKILYVLGVYTPAILIE